MGRRIKAQDLERATALSEARAAADQNKVLAANVNDLEKQLRATKAAETELRDRVKSEVERNKGLEGRMDELNKELVRLAAGREKSK